MKDVTGHFGQELNVGDKIAMVAKSYGSSYMLVANIHSIEEQPGNRWNKFIVKVTYPRQVRTWDRVLHVYRDDGVKNRISRVYNWRSAITLEPAKND